MEKVILVANGSPYSAEYVQCNGWYYEGKVYPITQWENHKTGERGWSYNDAKDGGTFHDTPNESVREMFAFSFGWRGVWEGRIYFKDSEYWSEELKDMSELWDQLQEQLVQKIKAGNPQYKYFD